MANFLCTLMLGLEVCSLAVTADDTVSLKYQLKPGQVLRYDTRQSLSVTSTITGASQEFRSETRALRVWKVLAVNEKGNARLAMSIERVRVEATRGGEKKISYDSEIPDQKGPLGDIVGRPLLEVTISPFGQVIEVGEPLVPEAGQFVANVRLLIYPVPPQPIVAGTGWQTDLELPVPTLGTNEKVRLRQTYRLEKLSDPVAAINLVTSFAEEIKDKARLTALMQFLPAGKIEFDISRGVVRSVDLKLDQKVTEFAGSDSVMQVTGSYGEVLREEIAGVPREGQ